MGMGCMLTGRGLTPLVTLMAGQSYFACRHLWGRMEDICCLRTIGLDGVVTSMSGRVNILCVYYLARLVVR